MKNKLISISIILMLIFISCISVEAIAPTPRIDLDEYQINITNTNKDIYITGTITLSKGQLIGLYDSTGLILYNFTQVKNSEKEESFKIKVPVSYIKEGVNTFKVKSIALKGYINASNTKTVNITLKTPITKKDQTITASNLTLNIGDKKNINAKVSSNLSLTYISASPNIATVDSKGNVIGRKKGTSKITIKQAGNKDYNPVSKTITVTVKSKPTTTPTTPTKSTYTVVFNPMGGSGKTYTQKIEVGKSIKLTANKFKRDGYKFVGWATKEGRPILSGTDVTKFKNVNMKHFQLGKVKYKNKASVKNLTSKGKTVQLYAVWKGCGPEAAADWGGLIAKDDNFEYNKNHKAGCWFCGTSKSYKGNKKNYVCMTYINACYAHGANLKRWWKGDHCNSTYISGHSDIEAIANRPDIKRIAKTSHYSKKDLKKGDILVKPGKKKNGKWVYNGHVYMVYSNNNGNVKLIECHSPFKNKKDRIAIRTLKDSKYLQKNKYGKRTVIFRLDN